MSTDGFERLGAVSGKTPQSRVHTTHISDAANDAVGDLISLNYSLSEFDSGLIDFSNLSIHSTTNNYNSSNTNSDHSNTTYQLKHRECSVRGGGGYHFRPSTVQLADFFPIEPGFSIPVHKAQVSS